MSAGRERGKVQQRRALGAVGRSSRGAALASRRTRHCLADAAAHTHTHTHTHTHGSRDSRPSIRTGPDSPPRSHQIRQHRGFDTLTDEQYMYIYIYASLYIYIYIYIYICITSQQQDVVCARCVWGHRGVETASSTPTSPREPEHGRRS
jgi:hypothetical protein